MRHSARMWETSKSLKVVLKVPKSRWQCPQRIPRPHQRADLAPRLTPPPPAFPPQRAEAALHAPPLDARGVEVQREVQVPAPPARPVPPPAVPPALLCSDKCEGNHKDFGCNFSPYRTAGQVSLRRDQSQALAPLIRIKSGGAGAGDGGEDRAAGRAPPARAADAAAPSLPH